MFDTFINIAINIASIIVTVSIGVILTTPKSASSINGEIRIFEVLEIVSILGIVLLVLWILAVYDQIDEEGLS